MASQDLPKPSSSVKLVLLGEAAVGKVCHLFCQAALSSKQSVRIAQLADQARYPI